MSAPNSLQIYLNEGSVTSSIGARNSGYSPNVILPIFILAKLIHYKKVRRKEIIFWGLQTRKLSPCLIPNLLQYCLPTSEPLYCTMQAQVLRPESTYSLFQTAGTTLL